MTNDTQTPESPLMTCAEVAAFLRRGEATISMWSREEINGFPAPWRIGPDERIATKMWARTEIYEWLMNQPRSRNVQFVGTTPQQKAKAKTKAKTKTITHTGDMEITFSL